MVNVSSTSTRGLGVAEQGEATVPEPRFPGRGHSSLQAVLERTEQPAAFFLTCRISGSKFGKCESHHPADTLETSHPLLTRGAWGKGN